MKRLFASLNSFFTKKRLSGISLFEKRFFSRLSPFDKAIIGFFSVIMIVGAISLLLEASNEYSVSVPARGGAHLEGVVGVPRFINPLLAVSDVDRDLTALVFGGLLIKKPNGTLVPNIAESFEVSDDGLTYTFTIRSDASFHDGTPITADDVVFTVTSAQNPEIKSPRRANWEGVSVSAPSTHTVSFSLAAPYGLFLENATMGILPKHIFGTLGAEQFSFTELNTNPIGSGPFYIRNIKKNSSGVPTEYELRAFDDAPHPPFLQTIIFKLFPTESDLVSAVESGAVGGAHSVTDIKRNMTLHETPFGRVFGIFLNQNQQELFTDTVVRRALDMSIDKNALTATILRGHGTPLDGPLPPSETAPLPQGEGESREQKIQNARTVLEENGWERGEDGVYQKESGDTLRRLSFSLTTSNVDTLRKSAEFVAEAWREVGIETTLQFFDQNDLSTEVIRPRRYDALLFGLIVGREMDLFAFWHTSQRNDPGLNIALYANITVDRLLEEARGELQPEIRREKLEEAAHTIADEYGAIFLFAPHFVYLTSPDIKGIRLGMITTPSDRFIGIEEWYVDTESLWPLFLEKNTY